VNGFTVYWDGASRVSIHASPSFKGQLKGLCGDFNDNSENDFTSKTGVVESDSSNFGNSWKVGI
jgi:hypothetical protein